MNLFGPQPTVLERLNTGLANRTIADTRFKLELFNKILQILRNLQQCPGAVAALPLGVANQLSITERELADFINRLENPDNMGADAINDIVDPLKGLSDRAEIRLTVPANSLPGDAVDVVPPRGAPPGYPGRPAASAASGTSFWPWGRSASPSHSAPGSFTPLRTPAAPAAPVAPVAPARSGWSSPFSRRRDPHLDVISSSSRDVDARFRTPIDSELDDMNSRNDNSSLGGSRRKTRRARKYRNRT